MACRIAVLSFAAFLAWPLAIRAAEPAASDTPEKTSSPVAEGGRTPDIEAAEALLRAGDFEGARKKLAEAQKKNPRLAAPGVILARSFLATNQTVPARAELDAVIAATPGEPEAYLILGELDWRDRRIPEAELLFRESLARARSVKDPDRKTEVEGQAHAGLATVAEARQRWAVARDELSAWSALDEKNPIPHQRLGNALFRLGKTKEALGEFQTAAKRNNDLIPELVMALLYEESGDRENSVRMTNAAIKRLPDSAGLQLAIANLDLEHDRIAEAKRHVEAALKLDANSLDAKILAGGIAHLQGDNAAAERYLEAAHLQSPTNFTASNLLALALADQDDPSKRTRALEFAQQNMEKYPKRSEAIATLGWAFFRLERWDEASRTLNQALATGTLNPDGAYFVAKLFIREGRTDDAKKLLSKAIATKRQFSNQEDAEALLAQLERDSAAGGTSAPKDATKAAE
jgi:tetratricopeptide (TPR) repeat protein